MTVMSTRTGSMHPRLLLGLLLLSLLMLVGCASTATAPVGVDPTTASSATSASTSVSIGGPTAPKGMAVIAASDLPPEGRRVLALIAAGGPFPYRQDGVVFQNREKLLPKQSSSYYHEYTVPTPGSADRGARRIVAGQRGERYYTDDHYDSFRWITP